MWQLAAGQGGHLAGELAVTRVTAYVATRSAVTAFAVTACVGTRSVVTAFAVTAFAVTRSKPRVHRPIGCLNRTDGTSAVRP